jgi:hypothetical protein
MTSQEAGLALARRDAPSSPWIESRGFDLAFFILSPLAGLALLLAYPIGGNMLAIAAAGLIGGPHYLASFSFFFWDDAAQHHRRRWIIHFVVPAGIVLLVAIVVAFRIPAVIMFVIYFWNAWHVARQSCGILSVYRLRGGYTGERHKRIVNAAIISTSLSMALWNLEWYPALHEVLSAPSPAVPRLLWLAATIASALSLSALAVSLHGRWRAGSAPSVPEWAFLATSLTLFHPYLWVRDADLATLGMLMGHFLQYLAIVWLVNRRRFSGPALSTPRYVAAAWRDPRLLLGFFLVGGSAFLLLQMSLTAITVTLVLLHFYLDGVFWAFRRPEVRKVLGPYLTSWRGAPARFAVDVEPGSPRPAG